MNYLQTIDYLYTQLPMFSRIGSAAYKADLHNTIALCNELGNPQNTFKSVHVAGTNGKGSTSHMLAAMLQQAGYKTGLYTSPHLKDFRERIKINGEMIAEKSVVDFVEKIKPVSEKIEPSFFELTVAMAFDHFAREKVDIAIIETGLGGRLDSTNIITPILSVITNIGYDHMNLLGNTLEKIAGEKAGIIKQNIPVVIGESNDEIRSVFINTAKEKNAPIFFAQEKYSAHHVHHTEYDLMLDVEDSISHTTETFTLDLNGLYQTKNLITVLCAEGILIDQGFTITDKDEKTALANTKKLTGLHGRWDIIAENPLIVLDVAHNEDGIKQVLNQIKSLNISNNKVHVVIGIVKDKDVTKVLSLLPKEATYYFTNANIPRAMPSSELADKSAQFGLTGSVFNNVNDALVNAKKNAAISDMIIVCGSVFLVGEVNY